MQRISLDLTDRAARRAFLADMSAGATKMLVLTEGVVPYLSEADVAELADDLRQAEKVRFWITDYFSPEAIKFGAKLRRRFMRNAPFQFAPKDWFGFFAARGWKAQRGPLHLRGGGSSRQAHSPAVVVEALGESGGRVRLACAPRAHEALRRLCAPGAPVR